MAPNRRRANSPPQGGNAQADLVATVTAIIAGLLPNIFAASNGRGTNQNEEQNRNPDGDIGFWLSEFQKQNPRTFSKARTPADSRNWIDHIDQVFSVLGVAAQFKAILAAFKLEGDAYRWWRSVVEERGGDEFVQNLSWEEFREIFLDRYFFSVDSGDMRRGYRNISQSDDEPLDSFTEKFCMYVGFLGASAGTQEEIARKYQWAVCERIRRSIIQSKFYTLSEVVDAAKVVDLERQAFRKKLEGGKKRDRDGGSVPAFGQPPQGNNQVDCGQGSQSKPWQVRDCSHCDRRHEGVCWKRIGACLRCGDKGHKIKDCPRKGQGKPAVAQNPWCGTCGRRHAGICRKISGACFRCGEMGHTLKDCPRADKRQRK